MKSDQLESSLIESFITESIQNAKLPITLKNKIPEIVRLTGDASTRRYYRATVGTTTLVVCLDAPVTTPEKEYTFTSVHSFLEKHNIRVPHIHAFDLKRGILVEEDLGDQTLIRRLGKIKNRTEEFDLYKKCVDILIQMQGLPLTPDPKLAFTLLEFDEEKLFSEIQFSIKHFMQAYLGAAITSGELAVIEKSFKKICERPAKAEKFFTHRDYHSRNIMSKGNELIVIDFQDARKGTCLYDLVSLLDDCYYRIDDSNYQRLKDYYWDTFARDLKDFPHKQAYHLLYDYMLLQRAFKALGSFGYIYGLRGDVRYLKFIGHTFEKIKITLEKHEEFQELKEILCKYYYEH